MFGLIFKGYQLPHFCVVRDEIVAASNFPGPFEIIESVEAHLTSARFEYMNLFGVVADLTSESFVHSLLRIRGTDLFESRLSVNPDARPYSIVDSSHKLKLKLLKLRESLPR